LACGLMEIELCRKTELKLPLPILEYVHNRKRKVLKL